VIRDYAFCKNLNQGAVIPQSGEGLTLARSLWLLGLLTGHFVIHITTQTE